MEINKEPIVVLNNEQQNKKHKYSNLFCCLATALIMMLAFVVYSHFFMPVSNTVNIITNTYSAETVEKLSTDITNSVEKVNKSVVEVYGSLSNGTSAGSGVIVNTTSLLLDNEPQTGTYYVITNFHVIEDAYEILVKETYTNKNYSAQLVGGDYLTDVAVLKIDTTDVLTTATIGNSSILKLGETVIAIGNPLGELGGSVSVGNISFLNRLVEIETISMNLIQTTTSINSGNSGGGLFNSTGDLIGIVNAKATGTGIEGIGFAIPINTALNSFTSLINTCVLSNSGKVLSYGYVQGRTNLGLSVYENNGSLYVNSVLSNSNSATATGNKSASMNGSVIGTVTGLEEQDRIISVNGSVIVTKNEFVNLTKNSKIGDLITIVVARTYQVNFFQTATYYITFNIVLNQYIYEMPTVI